MVLLHRLSEGVIRRHVLDLHLCDLAIDNHLLLGLIGTLAIEHQLDDLLGTTREKDDTLEVLCCLDTTLSRVDVVIHHEWNLMVTSLSPHTHDGRVSRLPSVL